jgi:pilus assembly protein FimV
MTQMPPSAAPADDLPSDLDIDLDLSDEPSHATGSTEATQPLPGKGLMGGALGAAGAAMGAAGAAASSAVSGAGSTLSGAASSARSTVSDAASSVTTTLGFGGGSRKLETEPGELDPLSLDLDPPSTQEARLGDTANQTLSPQAFPRTSQDKLEGPTTPGALDSLPDDDDPLARKLELAEEFRQIGDVEGARDLINEVLEKSDGVLKAKAQSMLDALS